MFNIIRVCHKKKNHKNICRCPDPGGSLTGNEFVRACSLLGWLMQSGYRDADLSWFGQEQALRPAGGESCIALHLGACLQGSDTSSPERWRGASEGGRRPDAGPVLVAIL